MNGSLRALAPLLFIGMIAAVTPTAAQTIDFSDQLRIPETCGAAKAAAMGERGEQGGSSAGAARDGNGQRPQARDLQFLGHVIGIDPEGREYDCFCPLAGLPKTLLHPLHIGLELSTGFLQVVQINTEREEVQSPPFDECFELAERYKAHFVSCPL